VILLTAIAVGAWKTFGENAEMDEGVSVTATSASHRSFVPGFASAPAK
jgi:hypothetical protein